MHIIACKCLIICLDSITMYYMCKVILKWVHCVTYCERQLYENCQKLCWICITKLYRSILYSNLQFWAAPLFADTYSPTIFCKIDKYYRTCCFINIIIVLTIVTEEKKSMPVRALKTLELDTDRCTECRHIPSYIHIHKTHLYWCTHCYRYNRELPHHIHWYLKHGTSFLPVHFWNVSKSQPINALFINTTEWLWF